MEESRQNDKQQTIRELTIFALGQLICLGLTFGVFALLHKLDGKVLLGGAIGAVTAILNYGLMAVGVYAAARKARQGDVAGGQRIITLSMFGRYGLMLLILIVFAKTGLCNVIAMLVPLVLMRPLIFIGECFRRKDG